MQNSDKKQRKQGQNKGENTESRTGTGTHEKPAGRKNLKERWQRKGRNKTARPKGEKRRRICRTYTDAREGDGCCTARRLFYKRFDREGKFREKRGGRRQCRAFHKKGLWESTKKNGWAAGMRGIADAKARLWFFGGEKTGQTAQGVKGKGKRKAPQRGPFLS